MKKDITICIDSTVSSENGDDKITFTANGRFLQKDGKIYISYKEILDDSVHQNRVLICIEENRTTITRRGAMPSQLIIENGKRNICSYSTPYGNIFIGIFGTQTDVKIKKNSADILLCYTIDADMSLLSENRLSMKIRECKNTYDKLSQHGEKSN